MEPLSRETILNQKDIGVKRVDVQEWNGYIFIKELSVADRFAYDAGRNGGGIDVDMGRLLAMSICDESGNLLFKDEDVTEIVKKNYEVITRIFHEIVKYNLMDAQAVEVQEKNLEAALSGASSSG